VLPGGDVHSFQTLGSYDTLSPSVVEFHRNFTTRSENEVDGGEDNDADTISYENTTPFNTPIGRTLNYNRRTVADIDPSRPSKSFGVMIDLEAPTDDSDHHLQPERFSDFDYEIITLHQVGRQVAGFGFRYERTDVEYHRFNVPNGAKGDKIKNIENVTGTNFIDVINGDERGNYLNGLGGDDILDGRGGRDVLAGGLGNDIFVVRPEINPGNVHPMINYMLADRITDYSRGDKLDVRDLVGNIIHARWLNDGNVQLANNQINIVVLENYHPETDGDIVFTDPTIQVEWL
jgi:Ca2+-binding RTX toxin-like protein